MDETNGARADSFGSNNLSEAGSGSVGSDTGVLNNAAKFLAADTSYLERISNASLQTGDINFTACCWVMLEGTLASSSQFPIISKWTQGDVVNCEWRVVFEAGDGLFEFQWSNGVVAGGVENGSFSPVAGIWFFLAAVHDAALGKINLYCNGVADFWVSRSGGVVTGAPFRVGAQDGVARYHNMRVDNVDLYKRMLSENEIIAMYNSGTPLAFPYA